MLTDQSKIDRLNKDFFSYGNQAQYFAEFIAISYW